MADVILCVQGDAHSGWRSLDIYFQTVKNIFRYHGTAKADRHIRYFRTDFTQHLGTASADFGPCCTA